MRSEKFEEALLHVLIKFTGDIETLRENDVIIRNTVGDIAIASIAPSSIRKVASLPTITFIELSQTLGHDSQ